MLWCRVERVLMTWVGKLIFCWSPLVPVSRAILFSKKARLLLLLSSSASQSSPPPTQYISLLSPCARVGRVKGWCLWLGDEKDRYKLTGWLCSLTMLMASVAGREAVQAAVPDADACSGISCIDCTYFYIGGWTPRDRTTRVDVKLRVISDSICTTGCGQLPYNSYMQYYIIVLCILYASNVMRHTYGASHVFRKDTWSERDEKPMSSLIADAKVPKDGLTCAPRGTHLCVLNQRIYY